MPAARLTEVIRAKKEDIKVLRYYKELFGLPMIFQISMAISHYSKIMQKLEHIVEEDKGGKEADKILKTFQQIKSSL